jgi:hypothetical protein
MRCGAIFWIRAAENEAWRGQTPGRRLSPFIHVDKLGHGVFSAALSRLHERDGTPPPS